MFLISFVKMIILVSAPADKLAYIDPSTGGMLFQILAVLFAAFSGFFFFFSRQIKTAFARLRRKMRGGSEEDSVEEASSDTSDQL